MAVNNTEGFYYILYNTVYTTYGVNVYYIGTINNLNNIINIHEKSYLEPSEIKYLSCKCNDINLAKQIIDFKLARFKLNNNNNNNFYSETLDNLKNIIKKTIETINNNNI